MGAIQNVGRQIGMANPRQPIVAPINPASPAPAQVAGSGYRGFIGRFLADRADRMAAPQGQPISAEPQGMPPAQSPQMPGPAYPATPMQVPVPSQIVQPTGTSQPQTLQGPGFLKQFGEGGGGGLTMSAYNPRAQFDAAMYRRGGTPWQAGFGEGSMWAPESTRQMAQGFAQGTMQPQAMPTLTDAQMKAIAQMVAGMIRM